MSLPITKPMKPITKPTAPVKAVEMESKSLDLDSMNESSAVTKPTQSINITGERMMPPTNSRPQISVWGASQVGKTTYLAGSLLAVNTFYSPQWKLMPGGEKEERDKTYDFVTYEMDKLQNGLMPEATAVEPPKKYVFQFVQQGNFLGTTGRYHEITMLDAAGGLTEAKTGSDEGYFAELCQSQGILMLVDPELREENGVEIAQNATMTYFSLVNRMLQYLQEIHTGSLTLNIPLAMCLTKIDQSGHWTYRENPKAYLEQILGKATFNQITSVFTNINYFAVSVAGFYEDPMTGQWLPNIDPSTNKIKNFRVWTPYKVLDPLLWLFDQLETERNRNLIWWRRSLRARLRETSLKS